jgi:hypothetical protein
VVRYRVIHVARSSCLSQPSSFVPQATAVCSAAKLPELCAKIPDVHDKLQCVSSCQTFAKRVKGQRGGMSLW